MTDQERAELIIRHNADRRSRCVNRVHCVLCLSALQSDIRQALTLARSEVTRCDCGEALTQCSGCAVADWQAAHPDCPSCCVKLPGEQPIATALRDGGAVRHREADECCDLSCWCQRFKLSDEGVR